MEFLLPLDSKIGEVLAANLHRLDSGRPIRLFDIPVFREEFNALIKAHRKHIVDYTRQVRRVRNATIRYKPKKVFANRSAVSAETHEYPHYQIRLYEHFFKESLPTQIITLAHEASHLLQFLFEPQRHGVKGKGKYVGRNDNYYLDWTEVENFTRDICMEVLNRRKRNRLRSQEDVRKYIGIIPQSTLDYVP